jgi:hypothetical protein
MSVIRCKYFAELPAGWPLWHYGHDPIIRVTVSRSRGGPASVWHDQKLQVKVGPVTEFGRGPALAQTARGRPSADSGFGTGVGTGKSACRPRRCAAWYGGPRPAVTVTHGPRPASASESLAGSDGAGSFKQGQEIIRDSNRWILE